MNAPIQLRQEFKGCPLCNGASESYGPPLYVHKVVTELFWMRCTACRHVHTMHYWTNEGLQPILATHPEQIFGGEIDSQRSNWDAIIHRILAQYRPRSGQRWVDVGTGNGAALFTAAEFGFDAIGIDLRQASIDALKTLGYNAERADALEFDYSGSGVVVLADILEHMPYPIKLLQRIREGLDGALFVSCPNMDCVSWRYLDRVGRNIFWGEPEHYHNFSRESLTRLLSQCGFRVVDYAVSRRYAACMEIIAV